ncbi:MAG: hypothetical protein H7Y36_09600, partial [Armatimonadetes bacterium]|nr:hypothetical protein [Akkermansiaceae bacterium]
MHCIFRIWLILISSLNADSLLNFSYGVLEESRGNTSKAENCFLLAYKENPTALPLVRKAAGIRLSDGDRQGAGEIYRDLTKARPDDYFIWIEYGDFLGNSGRGDSAADSIRETAYAKALELKPGDEIPIERMIRFSRELGDDEQARDLLEKLEVNSPSAVMYYVSTTKSLYDNRNKEAQARINKKFLEFMRQHPEWITVARAASEHFRQTNQTDLAIEVLRNHVLAQPSSLDMKIRLGILYFAAKRDVDGVQTLKEVLDIHPRKALAHESLAKYYRKQSLTHEAGLHAAELLKIRGGSPDDFLELAKELMQDRDYRGARVLLEKGVYMHEENLSLRMKLAVVSFRDPETKAGAGRLFREAEMMIPHGSEIEPGFLLESARMLIDQGNTKDAEQQLKAAIRTFPKTSKTETAESMRLLAKIWIKEERNQDAA